jgi:hypothetical protein
MATTRSTRSQRKTELRKKNVGVGVDNIEIDPTKSVTKGKKITFDDDYVASDYESSPEHKEEQDIKTDHQSDSESSDDEVEQVDNSLAKAYAMEQRAAESKTRREEYAIVHKRKRKTKLEKPKIKAPEIDSENEELDEEFLAMVDSDRKSEAKAKKQLKVLSKESNVGKHTTFVSDGDDLYAPGSMNEPIQAEHGIDVVVLPGLDVHDDDSNVVKFQRDIALSASLGTQPSTTAMSLCRGRIQNFESEEEGVELKRSRKMKYNVSRGRALMNFKVRC